MTDLVQKRQHRAEKVAWLLQGAPFIRLVSLTGSLAYEVAKESSDIDIFIIASEKRIWTCRFFVSGLLRLTHLYRVGDLPEERAGKICPNRYVTDEYLVINPQNRYHAQDYTQMIPLYDEGRVYNKFMEKNKWMEKYGFFKPRRAISLIHSPSLNAFRRVLEWFLKGKLGDLMESYFKKIQITRLKEKYPNINKPSSPIFVSNEEIRIHPRPR